MELETGAPRLVLITGIMAAGKSTVAQALAERFDRSVHLRGDSFRKAIVNGRVDMSRDGEPEARAQLHLRYRLMAQVADAYVAAGFTTIAQDVILGPMLGEVVGLFATPVDVIVLAPSVEVVEQREQARPKVGYTGFTPDDLDQSLRTETPRIGTWIDTSAHEPDDTVAAILDVLRAADPHDRSIG
jgi:predicted kinase